MIRVPSASDCDVEIMLLDKLDAFYHIILIFHIDHERLIEAIRSVTNRESVTLHRVLLPLVS